MVDQKGQNLIFILSTPRSGSTLLGALLGGNSQALCLPEPWILLCLQAIRSKDVMIVSHYDHELAQKAFHELVDDELFNKAAKSFLLQIYNSLLDREKKKIFIDKTPRYYHVLDFIDNLFPSAYKIWIKRNPLDVMSSYKMTWGHSVNELLGDPLSPHSFDTTVSYSLLSSYFSKKDPKKISLFYEDLIQDPVTHLKNLCKQISLPFTEDMLSYGVHQELIEKYEKAFMGDKKLLEYERPHKLSVGRWRSDLSKSEIRRILQTFGSDTLTNLGYRQVLDEAASLAEFSVAEISKSGTLDRIIEQYPHYVDKGMLEFGSFQHTLTARQNSQLIRTEVEQRTELTTRREQIELLTRQIQENERVIQENERVIQENERVIQDNEQLIQENERVIQGLSSVKGATKALVKRIPGSVRLYEFGKDRFLPDLKTLVKRIPGSERLYEFGKRGFLPLLKVIVKRIPGSVRLYEFGKDRFLPSLGRLKRSRNRSEHDFIIAHCEINERHGVGVLLNRIFYENENIFSIRSTDLYGGQQAFGDSDLHISHRNSSRDEILSNIRRSLNGKVPKRVLAVPYFTDDVLSTIAVKDLFDMPLCTFLMDDQNIGVNNIPDDCMKELLDKSDVRFGISRELCHAYEKKFGSKFWFLPPLVQGTFIKQDAVQPTEEQLLSKNGILIGNIWSQQWLDRLRTLTRESQIEIDWYCNPNREWLDFQEKDLQQDGINFKGYISEAQLIDNLRAAPYAVIPTGSTEKVEDRPEITRYSLPSRIVFITATSNTPILVVGNKESAAARFIKDCRIGIVCDYDTTSFRQSVDFLLSIDHQNDMRRRSSSLARGLSSDGVAEWIWKSVEKREPYDLRFEKLGTDFDIIITLDEMTPKHGTGALVKRIFPDSTNVFSIRSTNHYEGDHDFGDISICLPQYGLSRSEVSKNVSNALRHTSVKRVFCIPYSSDELRTAIAIKEEFGVPLGTYIMDDQNIVLNKISDTLMQEFLSKCSLRLATHPELRDAYEEKYRLKFWLLPAVVPDQLLQLSPQPANEKLWHSKTGALLGSIWSKQWFDRLCKTLAGTSIKLDWYGNTHYFWQKDSHEKIRQKGITPHGLLPEDQLAERLRAYPYIVVPTGMLDDKDDRPELSRLSLPGRIIFALAVASTPVILLGSKETSAASFVNHFGIGLVCDYTPESFQKSVKQITNPDVQQQIRQSAAGVAKKFSDKGITDWVWRSLELGEACDPLFEELMSGSHEK